MDVVPARHVRYGLLGHLAYRAHAKRVQPSDYVDRRHSCQLGTNVSRSKFKSRRFVEPITRQRSENTQFYASDQADNVLP